VSATARSVYTIWCDRPGCYGRVRSSKSRADARRRAVRGGWRVNVDKYSRITGYDYCPRHYERDPEEGGR
jgi:hypothetical protein